jgi:16S rRNA processing protein RimM
MPIPDDLVLVGHVTGAYGIQGWVRIRPYSSDGDALLSAKTWWLDKPELHDVEMLQSKLHNDEFYWVDLIGLAVVNERGEHLGVVGDLMDNGAHPILRVEQPVAEGEKPAPELLIPFVDQFVKTVDQAARLITVDWEADYS